MPHVSRWCAYPIQWIDKYPDASSDELAYDIIAEHGIVEDVGMCLEIGWRGCRESDSTLQTRDEAIAAVRQFAMHFSQ